jgi:cytochrome c-type biogenesis protein CcmH/NrfF
VRSLAIALAALALAAGLPAAAHAGPPQRASLSDIEDEVMCLVCGTPLNVSDSPQADRERAFIRTLIARGETKKQIKDALVAQYGRAVLATPSDKGFDLAAWIVPGLAVLLAAIGIAFAVVRWRRSRPDTPGSPLATTAGPAADERARLRSDLEHYDL